MVFFHIPHQSGHKGSAISFLNISRSQIGGNVIVFERLFYIVENSKRDHSLSFHSQISQNQVNCTLAILLTRNSSWLKSAFLFIKVPVTLMKIAISFVYSESLNHLKGSKSLTCSSFSPCNTMLFLAPSDLTTNPLFAKTIFSVFFSVGVSKLSKVAFFNLSIKRKLLKIVYFLSRFFSASQFFHTLAIFLTWIRLVTHMPYKTLSPQFIFIKNILFLSQSSFCCCIFVIR